MFTITEFDPFNADSQAWEDYFNFCKIISGNYSTKDEFKVWIKESLKRTKNQFKLIYQGHSLIIVIISFSKKDISGNEMSFIGLESIINEQSKELSIIIANAILQLTQVTSTRSFRISTAHPLIQEVMTGFSGMIINTTNFYQLYRNQLNERKMNDWRVNSYLQSDGLTLTIYEYVPEHLYDQFAVLMTELMNGIIREDSQEHFSQTGEDIKQRMEFYKKSRVEMLTLLLFDSGHELIGISFMLLYPNSVVAKQYMTGIKNQYRGKKLAGYLKAMITEEAFRRFSNIEKIETDCNLANKPMIYINQHTGYTLKKNSFQFKVETAKIEEFLAAG